MTSTLNIGGVAILNKGFCANKNIQCPPTHPHQPTPNSLFSVIFPGGPLPPRPPLDHWPVLHFCDHWQMTVKVVGWELAGSRGGNEIGGVITGKGAVETGGWVLANHWEIDEESTTRVGLQTTQTANQHQQKTITNTQESHKTDNSTQHTNSRISETIGIPSKKALKINSLLRRLLGIWSKVHET